MELAIERDDYWKIGGIAVAVLVVATALFFLFGGEEEPVTTPEETDGMKMRDGGLNIKKGEYSEDGIYTIIYKGEPRWNRSHPRISTVEDIDPDDEFLNAYISGYITEERGENVFKAEIYVDESFRDAVQPLNIAYGPSMEHFRGYQPEEVEDGVYRDTITDSNISRFKDTGPHSDGGVNVAIGNFTRERDKPRNKYTIVLLE